jgi:DNA-binding GntR family transcriptional regulator
MLEDYRLPRREPTWKGVYRNLRIAILNGDFQPDARLFEVELAQAMGVSRTPLREALAQLKLDGLISNAERGGYFVTDPRSDLLDSYHVRSAIEGYAARLAAEAITNVEIQALRENVAANAAADLANTALRAELNMAFHTMVARASRSPRIIQAFDNLREFIFTDEDMRLHSAEDCRQFVREHELLVDALELRDGDTADRVVRAHLYRAVALLKGKGPKKPKSGKKPAPDKAA